MSTPRPQKIDRFNILQLLGQGSQGVVYLAQDPQLNRNVAIKSVKSKAALQRDGNIEQLLSEARTVSKLQHANIVTIFDIGMLDGEPYLVLEYVDGESLQSKIRGSLKLELKIRIIRDILSGVAAAHAQNIIHCDIKPANILISKQGQAKVADFGLAYLAEVVGGDDALYGTPQYMAPEYIESRQHRKVSDVFSIGLVSYELLTGKAPFSGRDLYQILNALANTEIVPPAQINHDIDEGLNALLLKSLAKDPRQRFADADAMLQALNDYLALDDAASGNADNSDATVNFLLRRMRHKKDFPVFSQTISALNEASSSDTDSLTTVSNTILKDYSLTNKVLRLVNSAHYNRGGSKISTISRAVVMLGLNPVRSIATGLMLFEHMQNKMQSSQLKENAVQALFSGLLAQSLARGIDIPNHEEAFLCALLQQLGKMLVCFYLNEEAQAIDKLMLQQDCSETAAVTQVLGITYPQLGMSVAREWGFPKLIIDSLPPLDFDKLSAAGNTEEQLQLVAQFSSALGACLTLPLEQQAPAIQRLGRQFSNTLNLDNEKVSELLENSHKELTEFARMIQFDLEKSIYYQRISSTGTQSPKPPISSAGEAEIDAAESMKILVDQSPALSDSVEKALTDGIQDITNTLTGDYSINQIMQMILETIYRAFSGSRVVLCLKDKKTASIRARFGYGQDVEKIIAHFSIPLQSSSDVFQVAFQNNVDIRIENSRDEKIRNKIPAWYHQHIAAHSFTIFPIIIKQAPIALIYIDSAGAASISITDDQLGLLKTLRNQALLAIKNLAH